MVQPKIKDHFNNNKENNDDSDDDINNNGNNNNNIFVMVCKSKKIKECLNFWIFVNYTIQEN